MSIGHAIAWLIRLAGQPFYASFSPADDHFAMTLSAFSHYAIG
jgi:hypothetical protein